MEQDNSNGILKKRLVRNPWRNVQFGSFFMFLVFASSCVEKIPLLPKPDNLIEREKMITILTELVKIESAAQIKYPLFVDFNPVISNTGDSLLKSMNVNEVDFEKSIDYYGANQQEMTAMYDEVKQNLKKEMDQIRKEK